MEPALQITLPQARVIEQLEPGQWTIDEAVGGWTVRRGKAVLYAVNSRRPRLFKSLDTAVRKLGDEIGVTEFEVRLVKAAAD